MSDTKVCSKCGRELPATTLHFGVYRAGKDGLCPMCKPCRSAYQKACKLVNSLPPDKEQTGRKRCAEIYRLYYKTLCDSPAKQRILSAYYGITIDDLKNIITEEEEKAMLKKWTDEENQRLLAEAPGASMQRLAEAFGTSVGNISWRLNMLRRKGAEPAKKAATVNEAFDAEFPKAPIEAQETYAECAPEEGPATETVKCCDTCAYNKDEPRFAKCQTCIDVSGWQPIKPETVNARIAKLCELPDPAPAKVPEKKAPAKPPVSIYDRAHDIITLLRHNAEDQEIGVDELDLHISGAVIKVSASSIDGESIGWHKHIRRYNA